MTPTTNHICGPFRKTKLDGVSVKGFLDWQLDSVLRFAEEDRYEWQCQSCHRLYVVKDGRLEPISNPQP